MAPNSKHSETETERHNAKTKRVHANWAALPYVVTEHDRAAVHGPALHVVPKPVDHFYDHNNHHDSKKSIDQTPVRTATSLGQLFERQAKERQKPAERPRVNQTNSALDELQQKLKKQVGSIEEFIKVKLAAAVAKPTDNLFEKFFEAQVTPPTHIKLAVELVRSEQFSQKAQDLFDKLDKSKTGSLSRNDLAKALQDPTIKGADAQVLAAMYGQFDRLAGGGGDGIAGLCNKDLQEYSKTERLYAQETDLANKLARKASSPDSSLARVLGLVPNQFITQNQLIDIDNNAPMRPDDRELVQYMISHFDSMANAHGDRYSWAKHGVSLDDMTDYSSKVWHAEKFQSVISVNYILQRTNESQNNSCDELYADKINPLRNITPDAIKQGTIGDCYFEAAVASGAHFKPASIKDMIKDNGDGSYTVTFPGAKDEPLTVLAPTEAERGLFNNGSPAGTWASVLEKANGLYAQQHFWRRNILSNLGGGESPSEGGDGGGLGNGLSLLTGSYVDMHLLALEKRESLRSCLDTAINSNTPKSIITFTGPDLPGLRTTPDNFARSHVYTILAYDPNGADGGTLTIRNPWGNNESSARGTVQVSFDQYATNFCGFFAEQ